MTNDKRNICPHCNKKFVVTDDNKIYRPFCTKRCKMADLGQWLSEKFVVQGEEAPAGSPSSDDDDNNE